MKTLVLIFALTFLPFKARADFWGADLPLLMQIVTNTLHTMIELERQSDYMGDELAGIRDRIERVRTISNIIQPSTWDKWRDPNEAIKRLHTIYHTMPKEYRSEKYDALDEELSRAMNLVARVGPETTTTFKSGKELERRGADASPGVAQKLTASGIGTLISIESQTQAIQSHITSLLTQMLAEANEKETRAVVTRGQSFKALSTGLRHTSYTFSRIALGLKAIE